MVRVNDGANQIARLSLAPSQPKSATPSSPAAPLECRYGKSRQGAWQTCRARPTLGVDIKLPPGDPHAHPPERALHQKGRRDPALIGRAPARGARAFGQPFANPPQAQASCGVCFHLLVENIASLPTDSIRRGIPPSMRPRRSRLSKQRPQVFEKFECLSTQGTYLQVRTSASGRKLTLCPQKSKTWVPA